MAKLDEKGPPANALVKSTLTIRELNRWRFKLVNETKKKLLYGGCGIERRSKVALFSTQTETWSLPARMTFWLRKSPWLLRIKCYYSISEEIVILPEILTAISKTAVTEVLYKNIQKSYNYDKHIPIHPELRILFKAITTKYNYRNRIQLYTYDLSINNKVSFLFVLTNDNNHNFTTSLYI